MTPEEPLPGAIDAKVLAKAIAASLATDGYIDLFRSDGEEYPNGSRSADIDATAESITREYVRLDALRATSQTAETGDSTHD